MATIELFRQSEKYENESLARRLVRTPQRPDAPLSRTHRITWNTEREILCNAQVHYAESVSATGKRMVQPSVATTWAKRSNSGQLLIGQSVPSRGIWSHTLWRGIETTDQEFANAICRHLFNTVKVESSVMDKVLYLARQTPSVADSHPFLVEWVTNHATNIPVEYPKHLVTFIEREITRLSGEFARQLAGVTDARQAVAALFGKRAVRKDMVKALVAAHPRNVEAAWLVRDMRLLPVDHLVTLLRTLQGSSPTGLQSLMNTADHTTWRSLLHTLDPASRKRLLKRLYRELADPQRVSRMSRWLMDTVSMAQGARAYGIAWPTTADSLTELHDLLSDRLNHYHRQERRQERVWRGWDETPRMRREALVEYASEVLRATGDQLADHPLFWETIHTADHDQIAQEVDRMQQAQQERQQNEEAHRIAQMRQQNAGRLLVADRLSEVLESMASDLPEPMGLVVARDADTLWAWGDTLGHCIGNYDNRRTAGHSVLFGITHTAAKNDLQLLATGEVIIRVDADNQWLAALAQLYGHRNRELPAEQSVVIREVVEAAIAAVEVTPEQIQAAMDQATAHPATAA